MSAPLDLWDQAAMTDLIVRPMTTEYEDQPNLGDRLMPVQTIQSRLAKLRVRHTVAFGLGQFRAPDASPGLYKPSQVMTDTIIELALLDEMERLTEEDWMKLNSRDDAVAMAAGVDIVTRGQILRRRNQRLTEWMRWQVLTTGTLTVTYPTGQQVFIDYGIPAANKVTAAPLWSDTTNSDPIADLRSWSNRLAVATGYYGRKVFMASETFDYIVENAKLKALLTATNRSMLLPNIDDVYTVLRDGTEIIIYDNGYRAEGAGISRALPDSLTRFLPPGKILMIPDYSIEGVNIAETLDGLVTVSSSFNSVAIKQGMQAETLLDHMSKTHYFRVASSRIPRLIYPEAFLIGTVA